MNEHTIRDVLERIINKYGVNEQSRQAMEELAELIQAINKCLRYPTRVSRLQLIEEIADVSIMIGQLRLMYDIDDGELETVIYDKLNKMNETI